MTDAAETAACPGVGPLPAADGALRVEVGLGQRVMVVGDLLLPAEATSSSLALAADVSISLDHWDGPGTVVVCGNLFAPPCGPPAGTTPGERVTGALAAHERLTGAIRRFTEGHDRRLVVLPGWRDPEVAEDPDVVTELYGLGAEVAPAVDLRLATAAGERRVLVRPGRPVNGAVGVADAAAAAGLPWLAGIDRLEQPDDTARFVTSRTLYRRLGRFIWVPPLLAVVVAVLIRMAFVYHGVYHLVHRASGPRRVLVRAYSASWTNRFLFTLAVVVALELAVAALVAVVSRRVWRAHGGGDLPAPWAPRPWSEQWADADESPASSELEVCGTPALDEARSLVADGVTGLVTGGGLRAELTHLGTGFFACPGGTTELVREHPGRLGLPPVFLHHRQAGWIELETGADLHVRLLLADADLPSSTALERLATGYHVVKGYKAAADLHPAQVAAWPLGASWPAEPAVAARRVRVRRVRRVAAAAIFLAGLFDLLVAVSRPAATHLHLIHQYLPLGVAQAAGALVALAGIGLMMLARGVLRGQRRAWLVATVLLAVSLVLHLLHGASVGGLVVSGVVLALLIAERDLFGAASDHVSARSAATTVVVGVVAAVAAATAAIEVSGHVRHHPLPSFPLVLAAAAERLVGLHTVVLPDEVDDWVSPGLLAVGIGLALVALYLLTRPVVDRRLSAGRAGTADAAAGTAGLRAVSARRAAEHRARDIVRRHGTGTLDYFALRDDKQWFFHRDTLVAYAVYGGVCLISPDPIGPRSERLQAFDAFRRYCDRRGWSLSVMAAAEEWLPLYREHGHAPHVHRGRGGGRHPPLLPPGRADEGAAPGRQPGRALRLHRRLPRPVAGGRRGGPPAGRPHDPQPPGRRGAGLLHDARAGCSIPETPASSSPSSTTPAGDPVAMCQFVPSAAISGYSLDLMRRDPGEHPNGLLDFALCSTIDHLRQRGQHGLSLNFAAMRSTLEGDSGDGLTQRVERWALKRMSGVLQIESLWKFNAKYEPDWLPRYIVFDSPEQFAPAVVTILRAESLSEVPVIGRFLTQSAARRQAPALPGSDPPG